MALELPEETIAQKEQADEENNLDRRKISEESVTVIYEYVQNIDDPDLKKAVAEVAHILTGDDRFDLDA